jgi:hypothetical protein
MSRLRLPRNVVGSSPAIYCPKKKPIGEDAKQTAVNQRARTEHYRDDVFDLLDVRPPFEYGACSG